MARKPTPIWSSIALLRPNWLLRQVPISFQSDGRSGVNWGKRDKLICVWGGGTEFDINKKNMLDTVKDVLSDYLGQDVRMGTFPLGLCGINLAWVYLLKHCLSHFLPLQSRTWDVDNQASLPFCTGSITISVWSPPFPLFVFGRSHLKIKSNGAIFSCFY